MKILLREMVFFIFAHVMYTFIDTAMSSIKSRLLLWQRNKKLSYVQESAKSASSNRTLPLTPRAISVLEHLQQQRINEWVFNNVDNERLSYEALRFQTHKLCEEAKVEYRGEHVFRHTFATNCYYRGVDVKILSRLLGHADVNITYNLYIHLYGDGFNEMYEALVGNV